MHFIYFIFFIWLMPLFVSSILGQWIYIKNLMFYPHNLFMKINIILKMLIASLIVKKKSKHVTQVEINSCKIRYLFFFLLLFFWNHLRTLDNLFFARIPFFLMSCRKWVNMNKNKKTLLFVNHKNLPSAVAL